MVISSPCLIDNKELTSPEQTAPGKDFSNPLIVDSLLKTIWSSMHHVFTMKHWLVQSKRLLLSYIHPRSYPTRLLTLSVMANLEFCDKHNMVAFLEKSPGSAGFHQIIDFLNRSHICYALTKKPDVCVSFIKQFWRSAEVSTAENGEVKITATIDGHSMTITEGSLRRHLKLDDQDGISSIPNSEIFEQLALMGYPTDSDKLTFQKGAFSPQWRFLIHYIRHCLSPKKTAWEQFSSNIATAIGVLEDDLKKTKKTYSSAYTKLILRVKKLESQIKTGKARRQARVVLSDDEVLEDDSSKQGRKLSDAEVQEKASTETKLFIQEVTPTEVIQDQEGSEKGSDEVSTAGAKKGTASGEVPIVSTAEVNLSTAGQTVTYTRRSAKKRSRHDKGKAIMIESEPKKKSKKELEQERLSFAEAIRLEEQMNEEQRAQIARDEEIARQWDVEELYRLVKEKYSASRLEGYDLMLWGDLYTLFESNEEDEIWKNQHEYNLIS
ncbi:hypothetical protein Tco_1503045 [Tanacetum coccineum]